MTPGSRRLLVLAPVLAATYLSFHRLDANSFWLDEVYTAVRANLSWSELFAFITHRQANMSLHLVLLKLWLPSGGTEFAVRSLSVVFGVGSVVAIYAVGSRIFDRHTGLIAACLLAVNAYFIQYAQEARSYSLLLLLATLSVYFLVQAVETRKTVYFVALGFANGLILYANYFGVFLLAAELASLPLLPRGTIRWKTLMACAGVTALLALPLVWPLVTLAGGVASNPRTWIEPPSWQRVYWLLADFTTGSDSGGYLLILYGIFCAMGLAVAGRALATSRRSLPGWRRGLLVCWLFVPILGIYALSLVVPSFVDRYMMASLPALLLLASLGLSSLKPRWFQAIAAVGMVVLSTNAVFTNYYPTKKDEWRPATQLVIQNAQPGDAILFYSIVAEYPFNYYQRLNGPAALDSVYPRPFGASISVPIQVSQAGPTEAEIRAIAQRHHRLWVVLAYDMIEGLGWDSGPLIQRIDRVYPARKEYAFFNVKVMLYEAAPGQPAASWP